MTDTTDHPAQLAHTGRSDCICRNCCLDRAAQIYVDGLADRDAMTARDAAVAAGARTETEIEALATRIREARTSGVPAP